MAPTMIATAAQLLLIGAAPTLMLLLALWALEVAGDVVVVQRTLDGHKLESLLDELVTSGAELDRFVAETEGGSFDSTDDNLYLEYATPKGTVMTYDTSLRETIALLERYRPADVRARHLAP